MRYYMKMRIAMIVLIILSMSVSLAFAATPSDMKHPMVIDRLEQLYDDLGNKYFTTHQKAEKDDDAKACNMGWVIKEEWLDKATGGMIPSTTSISGTFRHFYNGTSLARGWSCCGFANYAEWYLFAQDSKDTVKVNEVAFVKFNKANMIKYAQPGDVLRFGNTKSSSASTHSAILWDIRESDITVIDSNWERTCKVTKHTKIDYSDYTYVGISRAKNYDYPTGYYTIKDTSSGTLIMRADDSSDSELLTRVPSGTTVKIIESNKNWGKYQYGEYIGWSNMNYMYFNGTYINELSFNANGGEGSMEKIYFDVGTGFITPECDFTKEGYHFVCWNLKNQDVNEWRYSDGNGNYGWYKDSEASKKTEYSKHPYVPGVKSNLYSQIVRAANLSLYAQWEPCEYETVIKKATMDNDGSIDTVCKTCGHIKDSVPIYGGIDVALSIDTYNYDGSPCTPAVTVTDRMGNKLSKGTDYTVSYVDNIDAGIGNVVINGKGNYEGTIEKEFVITLNAPSVKATNAASTGKINLSWNKVEGAEKYEVWRATSSNGTYSKIITMTGTVITNTSATAEKTYYYKVKAIHAEDSRSDSEYSARVSRTCDLAQPVVKVSNVASTGKVKLSWHKVNGAEKYEVWRATSSKGTFKKIITITGTSLVNSSTTAENTYYYKVKAISGSSSNANSAYSVTKARTCDLAQPVITLKKTSKGYPNISWKAVSGADKYYVYRKIGSSGEWKYLISTKQTSVTNTSISKGKNYYYKVLAVSTSNNGANSAYSSYKAFTYK